MVLLFLFCSAALEGQSACKMRPSCSVLKVSQYLSPTVFLNGHCFLLLFLLLFDIDFIVQWRRKDCHEIITEKKSGGFFLVCAV